MYQRDIANILNITQRNYSYIETETTDIPTELLIKLAEFYDTSTDYILYRTDVRKPYPRSYVSN